MGNITGFAAINTKLRVKKRNFLSDEDFHILLTKNSVGEITRYLKENTGYKEVLKNFDPSNVHRGDLEITLVKNIVHQIEDLVAYFQGDYRQFFLSLLIEYEIEDLKLILRMISRNEDISKMKDRLIHSEKYSHLDYERLLQSKNVEQFLENLKDTIYYRPLKTITDEDITKRDFHIEMKLETLFYGILIEKSSKLSKEDEKIIKESIGTNIDLINIQWIYRAMKNYSISSEEILIYCIANGYKLNYSKLKELVYSKNAEEFIEKIKKTKYAFIFPNDQDIFIERRIKRYLYNLYLHWRKQNSMNIMECISYIHFLQYEVKDIISVIESIRYNLDKDFSKRYLIREG
ncbi:V-type ATPase subunit [Defluviitalea saccharophila]|uniref:V-type ATPase subunit n=1 Tax=Defluviitalea saccharophila TaxID=879970 RepID=A0ABZ2Y8G4_9FIRM